MVGISKSNKQRGMGELQNMQAERGLKGDNMYCKSQILQGVMQGGGEAMWAGEGDGTWAGM